MSGCETTLFESITEDAANEVVAALLENEIPASKKSAKEGMFTVMVDESQFPRAVQILKIRALPRPEYQSMGQIFKKEGLLSTPLEEKARFIYAISQELSDTISRMDGVLTARVHIVPMETNELGEKVSPATVSVFIRHTQNAGPLLMGREEDIRKLVSKSVQGVESGNIYISLFATDGQIPRPNPETLYETVFGISVRRGAGVQIWMLIGIIAALAVAVAGLIYWFRLRDKPAA